VTTKRFSISNLCPDGSWEPSTLLIDSASARNETLSFRVTSTRGKGSLLYQGEFYKVSRRTEPIPSGPNGYERLTFDLDPPAPVTNGAVQQYPGTVRTIYVCATVVADEILQAAKTMLREKPKRPVTKTAADEIRECVSCHAKIMARGSDNSGWTGIQMKPEETKVDWYCINTPCMKARDVAISEAKTNWGYEDTTGAPVSTEDDPTKKPYGDLPDKPFL